ncbi:MAG: response regulator, partial [Synergistaceae bacterium]|nr:response regulator [Synergistaceae bacterium]
MRPLKVVIADTDDLLQRLYADLVSEEPEFVVAECVADRQGLIASLRRVEPELVLLDIYLKDFDSEKDLGDLRKKFLRTDYIALSSGGDPETVRRTLCQGAFEYLVKPFLVAHGADEHKR